MMGLIETAVAVVVRKGGAGIAKVDWAMFA
jgi:hypothetical protein